jgi:beta-galactosidase/beta-glucuronidase
MKTTTSTLLCILLHTSYLHAQEANWFPIREGIESRWAMELDPFSLFEEYPRPALERAEWLNLNGLWQFSIRKKEEAKPEKYDRHILVPFAPESKLSGVGLSVSPEEKIWYRREFYIPEGWSKKFIQLNFGASDWETTVYINGQKAGIHRGGYDPFSLDITYFLNEAGKQTIEVGVWDPTDAHHQARGKQKLNPEGIWYTPVSGIWQTVWIEPVESARITRWDTTTDIDASKVLFNIAGTNLEHTDSVFITVMDNKRLIATGAYGIDEELQMELTDPILWTPDNPHLYQIEVRAKRGENFFDAFTSYFGMRKVSIEKDADGTPRILLNNRPIFLLGVLDQGWWPAGLYTAPGMEALQYDIDQVKSLGFNTIRKHVKVEPAVWYRHCDEKGLLVWQDIPNSDQHAEWEPPSGIDGVEIERSFASEAQFKITAEDIVVALKSHPSVIYWCPFNEGWGQFKTEEITTWMQQLDPTRIVGGPSGGNDFPVGHTRDIHSYPGPAIPAHDGNRALVLGEFGGLGYPATSHLWNETKNWSYQPFENKKDLEKAYISLLESLIPLQKRGLCAAIYTQLTDVENEINGIMTYDRAVLKLSRKQVRKIHQEVLDGYRTGQ